jgi:hypothetical protein
MNKYIRLLTVLYLFLFFVSPAKAAFDVWDVAGPWGSSPAYYAGWNVFDVLPQDNTPDAPGSGAGSVYFYPYSGGPVFMAATPYYGSGNVSMPNPSGNVSGILSSNISGMDATLPGTFDVYLRLETYKAPVLTDAYLFTSTDSYMATSIVAYSDSNYLEYEYYWLFQGIPADSTYQFKVINVGNLFNQTNFTQVDIAVVGSVTPVPEPMSSSLMIAALFMLFLNRKASTYLKKISKIRLFKHAVLATAATTTFSAHAAIDTWDSATPWGSATTAMYVGWNNFDQVPVDSTPDVAGSGGGSFTLNVPDSAFYGGGNVYSPPNNTSGSYSIVMQGSTGGFYDIYLRIETGRATPTTFTGATLIIDDDVAFALGLSNDFQTTQLVTFFDTSSGLNESESYWVWHNIPGSNFYNVMLAQDSQASGSNYYTIFSQAEMAAVAIPVPEPESKTLFMTGLFLIGMMVARRKH